MTQQAARALEERFCDLASCEGYRELGLSAFTARSELEKSMGSGSDVVAKALMDLDDGVYAPEGTPQVLSREAYS